MLSVFEVVSMALIAALLGVALSVLLSFWLRLVRRPTDKPGRYHAKSLVACIPLLYIFLSWMACVVSFIRAHATMNAMPIGSFHIPLHFASVLLAFLPIPLFGKSLSALSPEPQVDSPYYGSHDHELEHQIYAWIIYVPVCLLAYIAFAIWPTLLNNLFGWARLGDPFHRG
jgi:hypothetical protein